MPEKVRWGRGRKKEFSAWLVSELYNTLGDRIQLERQWATWIEQMDAPRRGSADFPFPGASNEEMPITAMHAEPVMAQFMQSLHAPPNFWSAQDLSGEFTDSVNAITEYLSVIDRLYLRMREVNRRALPDLVILGTGAYHPTWQFQRKKVRTYDENGKAVSDIQVLNQPVTRHIPLPDFIWPSNAWDIDPDALVAPARWAGHRLRFTQNQLRAYGEGQEPYLPNFDKEALAEVLRRETDLAAAPEVVKQKVQDLDQLKPAIDRKIELFRIEARFDVDGDDIDEDIIVIFHYPTGEILQAVFQFWEHGKRLYEVEQYIQTFSLLGKGIASMDEWAQAAMSKLLNAQIDNAVLANTRMFGVPENYAITAGEPIFPGKLWPLAQGEQIQEVRLSDIYDSLFAIMQGIQQTAESRTSVSELRTGNIQGLPSRTPATTVLSLLNEGNKKFDMILSNMRRGAMANIGKRTLQMIAQRHRTGDTKWGKLAIDMLGQEDGAKVISILDLPQTALDEGLGIEVSTTSSQANKEVEKQNMIGLAQFMATAYPQFIQAAQLMQDQQLMMQAAAASYNGGREIVSRLLEAFDIQNPERYLPQPIGNGQQQPQLGAGGIQPGLAPVPTGQQTMLLQNLLGLR